MEQNVNNNASVQHQVNIATNNGGNIIIGGDQSERMRQVIIEEMGNISHAQIVMLQELILSANKRANADSNIGVILDIGTIRFPNDRLRNAEIRFTISNYTSSSIKITDISMIIVSVKPYPVVENQYAAGPIDEYFLYCNIEKGRFIYPLLDRHFEVREQNTEGFFLKVDACCGQYYDMQLKLSYHVFGSSGAPEIVNSMIFNIAYPVKDIDDLLQIL